MIQISNLPPEIQNKIPVSLRIASDTWELNDLPTEVQYLIYEYQKTQPPDIQYKDKYDAKPILTAYNDLASLELKDAIIEYFNNFLKIGIGTYPFDVTFGSKIKEHLQTKDSYLRQLYLTNELNNICVILTNDYNIPITILSTSIERNPHYVKDSYIYSEYVLNISLKINDDVVEITA